jgi:error-prone DNA polymerase
VWAIRGLSAALLPLFVAADEREQRMQAEVVEPQVALEPMSVGR